MRTMPIAAVFLLGLSTSLHSQTTDDATRAWFLTKGLVAIPEFRQGDATVGTLIAFLPNGTVQYITPPNLPAPTSHKVTIRTSEANQKVQVNLVAQILSVGLAGKFASDSTMKVDGTDFTDTGYSDDFLDNVLLQPNTPVATQYDKFERWDQHYQWDGHEPGPYRVFFIQHVFSASSLHVENVRTKVLAASGNATTPSDGSCVPLNTETADVRPPADPRPGSHGPAPSEIDFGLNQVPGGPGAGISLCYGHGGKDTLKSDHDVPVAMTVVELYKWYDDSYNYWDRIKDLKKLEFNRTW